MNFVLSEEYSQYKNDILNILKNFKNEGVLVGHGNRNTVKYFVVNDLKFNFKSGAYSPFCNLRMIQIIKSSNQVNT